MLGLQTERPKTRPMVTKSERSSPAPMPDRKKIDRKVFLLPEQWARLSALAEFHEAVFRKMERTQSVSRNDVIENFLTWAEKEYWGAVKGEPDDAKDREEKIAAYAKILLKQESEEEAAKSRDADSPKTQR